MPPVDGREESLVLGIWVSFSLLIVMLVIVFVPSPVYVAVYSEVFLSSIEIVYLLNVPSLL